MAKTLLFTLLIISLFSQLSIAQSKNEQIEKLKMDLDSSKNQQLKLVDQIIELNKIIFSSQENYKKENAKFEFIINTLESKIRGLQNELDSLKEIEKTKPYSLSINGKNEFKEETSKNAYLTGLKLASIDSTDLAIEELIIVIEKHNGKIGGEIAQFILGRQYMNKGEFSKALNELENVKSNDPYISSMSLCLQGDCHSEMKDYKKAGKKYLEAAAMNENELTTPMYLLKAGMCAEKENDFDLAFECYSKIKDSYPTFANKKSIDKYLDRLLKSKN
jgi:tetratricopeptide (TPR) repeat protein